MTKNLKIVLTGGAGFIGSHAYVDLVGQGYNPIIVDNFSNSKKDVLERLKKITNNEVIYYSCDCADNEALGDIFKKENPGAVMHFAALKSVSESQDLSLLYYRNNINSLISVLESMKLNNCKNIIFSSSATVYSKNNDLPLKEDSLLGYTNPYGHTKLICEQIIQEFCKLNKIKYGILRYFNPVGVHISGLIGEDPQGIPNNLMPFVALVAKGQIDEVNVYGNDYDTPDGTGIRDYIHISDLISGHTSSLSYLEKNNQSHIINLGTGVGYSVLDLINSYSIASNKEIQINFKPRREGDIASCYADNRKAKEILGWTPSYSLHDMCSSSWRWISNND